MKLNPTDETTRSFSRKRPFAIAVAFGLALFSSSLAANAATYYSTYGQTRTTPITAVAGTHTFEVDGIAINKWTEWYVNSVYTGSAQNDYSGIFANDPTYSYAFSSGTTQIRALVYNSDFSILHETHTWNVTVDTTAPTVPSLSSPANGSATSDNTVPLDWSDSSDSGTGVSNYEVQVDDSSGFGSPNYSATPTSSSATTSALSDGLYYWRVRAKDNAGNWSSYSSSRTFRVDTTAPSTPSLSSPSNGSSTSDQTPTFDWGDSTDTGGSGVSYYEVEIYDGDITWGDISTTTTSSTYTPSSNIPLDTIYWQIRAVDNAGNKSAWSAEWSVNLVDIDPPSVPSLVSPSDGSATADNTVSLDWNDSTDSGTGVSNYEVQVDDSSSFASPNYSATPGSSSATTSALGDGLYYWRVRAKDNAGNWSSYSSFRTFRVDTTAPTIPTLLSPANGSSTSDQTPTFDWSDSTDSGSGLNHYEFEAYDGDITWGDISATTISSTLTPGSAIPLDRIYWRVRAVDNVGNVSAWSTEFWFDLVDIDPPSVPSLVSPADASRTANNAVALDWNDSTDFGTGVSNYEVQVDDSISFASPNYSATPSSSSATTSALGDGLYYWRVRAKDNAGNWSSYSSSRTFRVDTTAPTIPTLLSPTTGSSTGDQTPTFDWTDSSDSGSGLSHYEVEVYDGDITWGDISTTVTASTFTPGGSIPFDRIYWRIRAVDNVGNKSAWSTEFWFDLVNNPPTQPGTITPSNVTSNSASIAWIASADTDGDTITYEVEYGVNNTLFWTSAGTTTSTSRPLTSLQPETTYVVRVRATDGKGGESAWRELDPAFTTRPVKEIVSAYWLPPLSVAEGTMVTMRAEVYGYSVGTDFTFTIFEDDGLLNDETVTNLTGKVYQTNGTFYVDATWITKWQNDQSGDPEFYFEAASSGVSKKSGKSTSEELIITTRRVWHASGFAQNRVLSPGSPTLQLSWSANERPAGAKLAQVAFILDLNLGSYIDNELELTCFGPGWEKSRTLTLTSANRQGEVSFDRDAFPDGFSADSGNWGVRVENLTAAKGNVTFTRLDIVITYFTSLIENPLPASANNNRKVVVMIHGWNPGSKNFSQHYEAPWTDLSDALIAAKNATTGWDVTRYNWVEDAATGSAGVNSQVNSVASRDAAVAHGLHLGKELESKYPNLEKVQLVAHSAGNWAARGAARYLKGRFPNADIQVTSLDAFIPNAPYAIANMPSNLKIFEEMGRSGWTPKVLDNYYVVDVGTLWDPDSDVIFKQTSSDFAEWNINRQLDADVNYAPLYDNATMNEHGGPILWYARSVESCNAGNSTELGGLGFAASLMFTEPRARIESITPTTAQPSADSITFQGSGTVNGGSVAAWEWSSSVDGILSTNASFTKSSGELTVGPHAISFRIRDNQDNWSDSMSANITVNNAIPTATMSGIPGTPVLAGTVLNLTLSGQDNDENGQSVAAGELSVSGSIVATPLGSYNFTAPAQAGDYTISYRVRDDEGAWSASTNQTLTVSPPCSFILSSSSANFGAAGGNSSVSVTASSSGCIWQSSNPLSWVTITSVANGTGNGTLNYIVAPNTSTNIRSGALTIAEQSFNITQAGTLNPWFQTLRRLTNGVMQITLTGEAGQTYVIEISPDMSNWTPIDTNVANGGVLQFNDVSATNSSIRFYRGRLQ